MAHLSIAGEGVEAILWGMVMLPSVEQEREIVERVLAGVERPAKMRSPRIEFREDHAGEDSIFITFPVVVTRSKPLAPKEWKAVLDFMQKVGEVLGNAHLQRFPYTYLSETTR